MDKDELAAKNDVMTKLLFLMLSKEISADIFKEESKKESKKESKEDTYNDDDEDNDDEDDDDEDDDDEDNDEDVQTTTQNCSYLKSKLIGKYVIVRTYSAGVHYGILKEKQGTEVVLENSRRIWSWKGAFTLSEIAMNGVSEARLSNQIPYIEITQSIEIIPLSEKAKINLNTIKDYKP